MTSEARRQIWRIFSAPETLERMLRAAERSPKDARTLAVLITVPGAPSELVEISDTLSRQVRSPDSTTAIPLSRAWGAGGGGDRRAGWDRWCTLLTRTAHVVHMDAAALTILAGLGGADPGLTEALLCHPCSDTHVALARAEQVVDALGNTGDTPAPAAYRAMRCTPAGAAALGYHIVFRRHLLAGATTVDQGNFADGVDRLVSAGAEAAEVFSCLAETWASDFESLADVTVLASASGAAGERWRDCSGVPGPRTGAPSSA